MNALNHAGGSCRHRVDRHGGQRGANQRALSPSNVPPAPSSSTHGQSGGIIKRKRSPGSERLISYNDNRRPTISQTRSPHRIHHSNKPRATLPKLTTFEPTTRYRAQLLQLEPATPDLCITAESCGCYISTDSPRPRETRLCRGSIQHEEGSAITDQLGKQRIDRAEHHTRRSLQPNIYGINSLGGRALESAHPLLNPCQACDRFMIRIRDQLGLPEVPRSCFR